MLELPRWRRGAPNHNRNADRQAFGGGEGDALCPLGVVSSMKEKDKYSCNLVTQFGSSVGDRTACRFCPV